MTYGARSGNVEIIEFLIKILSERLGRQEMVNILNKRNKFGNSSLYLAASNGHVQVVSFLLTFDETDVNTGNEDGKTPLHRACDRGHLSVVKCLLEASHMSKDEKREYLEMKTKEGKKGVVLARENKKSDIVQVSFYAYFSFNTGYKRCFFR